MLCLSKLFIITIDFSLFTSNYRKVQGAEASWLVPLSPDREVWVLALAKDTVGCSGASALEALRRSTMGKKNW